MGTLVFQATLGGAVNIIGPNIASTINFTLPSADGSSGQTWTTNGSGVLSFGTLGIGGGGTGQTTATAAFNALAPSQTGNSGKYLTTDGTNTSWATNPLGTVTSVGGTGTVSGISLSGTVTTSGNLTLGGALDLSAYNGAGAFTTLSASSTVTLSGGTANGVTYLNGSKVLTSGSALVFDGTNLGVGLSSNLSGLNVNGAVRSQNTSSNISYIGFTAYTGTSTAGAMYSYIGGDGRNGGYLNFSTSDSEQMRLTSTGLGIGTSSPAAKLDVQSSGSLMLNLNSTANTPYMQFSQSGTAKFYIGESSQVGGGSGFYDIYAVNALGLRFYTNGVKAATLDTSGNLGLGVTPSAWGSTIKAIEVGSWGAVSSSGTDGKAEYLNNAIQTTNAGAFAYKNTAGASRYSQQLGAHAWYTAASGTAGNAITFTQAMTLDASGNLGVGTTSPALPLHVYNASAALAYFESTSANGPYVIWRSSGTSIGDVGSGKGISGSGNATDFLVASRSGPLLLGTGSTERARIDSSGNLLVGTTSTSISSTGFVAFPNKTQVVTDNAGAALYVAKTGANGDQVYFYNSGSLAGYIGSTSTTVSYNTSSDYRLKNTIAPMTGALAKVALLKPCTYKWNSDGSDGEGFIAHELAEVVPQAVSGEKDAVDADGNPKYQGIDTSFLVATLTAAIQELKAEFDAYKASHP